MATKKKSGWAAMPAKAPAFDFGGDALKKAWKDLHAGDAEPFPDAKRAAALIKAAIDACERYFQAFQFVVWAGKTAKEGLEGSLLETVGEA